MQETACNSGDPGSNPRLGRSPGEGNGNPLQYSFLENSMDRGTWWATVHGVAKSQTQLSDYQSHITDKENTKLVSHTPDFLLKSTIPWLYHLW